MSLALTTFSVDLLMGNLIPGGSWLEPMYLGWVSFLWINRACVSPEIGAWHLLTAFNSLLAIKGGYHRDAIPYINNLFVFSSLMMTNVHLQLTELVVCEFVLFILLSRSMG